MSEGEAVWRARGDHRHRPLPPPAQSLRVGGGPRGGGGPGGRRGAVGSPASGRPGFCSAPWHASGAPLPGVEGCGVPRGRAAWRGMEDALRCTGRLGAALCGGPCGMPQRAGGALGSAPDEGVEGVPWCWSCPGGCVLWRDV